MTVNDLDGFNANDYPDMGDFDPVPAGDYKAAANGIEWKDNSKGTGQYLQFPFDILEGEFKGRTVWARLNLRNPSDKAVQIAKQELATICRAAGKPMPKSSLELQGVPMWISVITEPRNDQPDKLTNRIKGYKSLSGYEQATSAPSAPQQQSFPPAQPPMPNPAANTAPTPPWKN